MDSYSNAAINLLLLGRLFRIRGIRLIKGVYNLRLAWAFLFQTIKGPLRKKKVKKCSIREMYHSLQCQGLSWLVTELGLK